MFKDRYARTSVSFQLSVSTLSSLQFSGEKKKGKTKNVMDHFFLNSRISLFFIQLVFPCLLNVSEKKRRQAVNSVGRVDLRISFRFITSRRPVKTIVSFLVVRPKPKSPSK